MKRRLLVRGTSAFDLVSRNHSADSKTVFATGLSQIRSGIVLLMSDIILGIALLIGLTNIN